jgi:fatty-acid desaturase
MNMTLPRIKTTQGVTDAAAGSVRWVPSKSLWVTFMYVAAFVGGYYTFSWKVFALFVGTSAISLCLGHSLGMHRRLIHSSYECPKWLEYIFVHFGVLVGLAGPFGMVKTHDMRDWAQRQKDCHSYFAHREFFLKDAWWQLHCDVNLVHSPQFVPEAAIANDRVYRFMERTWMLQQLPWAVLFFLLGGVPWVVWGICVRVAVCVTGHWLIGYFAHNSGDRSWHVDGASVQGYNVKFCGLITMGECWHNNHHAFPGSALLGLEKGQVDPGWWVLRTLQSVGLVWNIRLPEHLPYRPELHAVNIGVNHSLQARRP